MEILAVAFWFVFGTIFGSFINVVSFRYGTGRTMSGRSRCFSCGIALKAQDLIPIASYFLLKRRCRFCKTLISSQYPAVELIAGILSALVYVTAGQDTFPFVPSFLFWNTLLFILIYDIRHKIILDRASLLASLFALASAFGTGGFSYETLFSGPILATPLFALSLLSRGRYMGLGDGKLMLALGWFFGLSGGFALLLFAFWMGAIVGGVLLMVSLERGRPRFTMKSEIPFAPYLILGAALVYFTDADLLLTSLLF